MKKSSRQYTYFFKNGNTQKEQGKVYLFIINQFNKNKIKKNREIEKYTNMNINNPS